MSIQLELFSCKDVLGYDILKKSFRNFLRELLKIFLQNGIIGIVLLYFLYSLQEVSNVDDSALSVSIRLVFYVYWNDSRVVRLKEDDGRSIQLGMKNIDKYFLPDFYIYNLLDFKQSEFADPLKAILLTPSGQIW